MGTNKIKEYLIIYVFNANDTTKPLHFFNLMIILFKTKDDLQPSECLQILSNPLTELCVQFTCSWILQRTSLYMISPKYF